MKSTGAERTRTNTRQRVLEAAGEVFAERGFRAATVGDLSAGQGESRRRQLSLW